MGSSPSADCTYCFQSNVSGFTPVPPRVGTSPIQVYKHSSDPTKSWSILKPTVSSDSIPQGPHGPKPKGYTRFVCLSDTHNRTDSLHVPHGDILIHAGDFTLKGYPREVTKFNEFLGCLPHKYKIVIAGNHDVTFDSATYADTLWRAVKHTEIYNSLKVKHSLSNCVYLEDCGVKVLGFKIFGSPWQPEFHNWGFNLPRGVPLLEKWNQIPEGTDILVTHGPPVGQGDLSHGGVRSGCVELLRTVRDRVKPKYHIFGHIHEGYGVTTDGHTIYVNASVCNTKYKAVNPPIVFDLPNQ